ncbi:hypothetical protein [Prosthecobacter sp.]|uniref:hypothetical protein n=1 Tax=Prosthecobacter sp. TaxID=1965333 RepID=UPI0037843DD6
MLGSARVVQFMRSKAAEWHIDPIRIALTRGAAGTVNAKWIAYRDEMAKDDGSDPQAMWIFLFKHLKPERATPAK